jgi:hypothetical protein
MLVAVAALAAMFFSVPTPTDVTLQPAFSVQGYSPTDKSLTDRPQFEPETAETRPVAHVSMKLAFNGQCAVAQTETGKDGSSFEIRDTFRVVAKERYFEEVAFPGRQDLASDASAWLSDTRIRFVVVCKPDDGNAMLSSFYEIGTSRSNA